MLDHFHQVTPYGQAEIFYYECAGYISATGVDIFTWVKPRGKSMINILLVGGGGEGGRGANATAGASAGGGGGGSGSQTIIQMPLTMLPDRLYICLRRGTGARSRVSFSPDSTTNTNNCLVAVNNGGDGGSTTNGTGGTAGAAGAVITGSSMPWGWGFLLTAIAGQAGAAGAASGSGNAVALPTSGLIVQAGAGGGGVPTSGGGGAGGIVSGSASSIFPGLIAASGGSTTTTSPQSGGNGFRPIPGTYHGHGGGGGGGMHATATGAGLTGADGGAGAPGCGGGGGGGSIAAGTRSFGGVGGNAFCVITCW